MLALADTINAQIVYTDVNPDVILTDPATDSSFSSAFLDLDGDSVNDFTLWALSSEQGGSGGGTFNLAGAKPFSVGNVNVNGNGIVGYTHNILFYASALNQDVLISPSQNIWTQVNRVGTMVWDYLNGNKYGQWKNDVIDKYMGVHFKGGDGNFHFGWVRMDVFQNPIQVTVKDFAYESAPNMPIHAGDAGSIGISSVNDNSGINIFVFDKEVYISSSHVSDDQMTVTIRDLLGTTVLSQTCRETNLQMSLKALANSIYLITVSKGNEVKTIKASIR